MKVEPEGIHAAMKALLAYGKKGSCVVGKVGAPEGLGGLLKLDRKFMIQGLWKADLETQV